MAVSMRTYGGWHADKRPTRNPPTPKLAPAIVMDATEVAALIRGRQTWKVLATPKQPMFHSEDAVRAGDEKVSAAIAAAGWAPFHFDRAVDGIAEPWRVHVLGQSRCRALAGEFPSLFTDIKPSNKLPAMLSACGALVLVTWLPQFSYGAVSSGDDGQVAKEKQLQIDEEHLAATSAYVQNLMLMLTADGLGTYWSSGGQFRLPKMFDHLQIPSRERLLAAVFVDYDADNPAPERLAGKHRESRQESGRWSRWQ